MTMPVKESSLDLGNLRKAIEALAIAFDIYDHNILPDCTPEKIVLRDGVIQRNQSSHVYNEMKAASVFSAARDFLRDAQSLFHRLEVKIND